ncbi:hypothetical protein I6M88_08085 [Citrobacter sedlakii]|uniref:Type VI secretion protein n=1 Tax=Citrobacter sedlakii TaxID=67826 RepID=A0ABS0ZQB2_9ENTR|nr:MULTISPECIES: membrane protein [Citrobacter]MBJ8380934.1 hypothetical protein [Citrobacter sedlakii]MBM9567698.1 hypothetical protein [Citrobacter sedlakii]MEB0952941.1 hypothetical protein [Citrobacter sedlakii]HBL4690700.1 hypothetical protein [Citrobacter sedlakii]HBL4705610.1 hypothetical protein [Citrobacter sedlakii]
MPVLLDTIPEKAAKVPRPDTRRWLLFLAFILSGGIALTFWNWTTERTGFIFWFTALGLPFCLWGLFFSLRRLAYKAEQVGAESRNVEREALIEREICRGQRCAWILESSVQHISGNSPGALMKAVDRAISASEASTPRGSKSAVRYAALASFQSNLDAELISATSTLVAHVQKITDTLPEYIPCCLMLDCDDDIRPRLEEHFRNELAARTGRSFRLLSGKGMAAFDAWLDQRWDTAGILAGVTFSLPAQPDEGDADAITLLVLSNRKAVGYPDAVCLHRPEKGQETRLVKTLDRALLWAATAPEALKTAWYTGPVLSSGSGWNMACEDNGVRFSLSKDNHGIDPVLGYAERAAPWLAIILASAACSDNGPQVIAAQPAADKDDIWVAVITKEEVCKGTPENV